MIGAIIGDTVGSRFEFHNIRTKDFEFLHKHCHPTDDSVMTIAVADAVLKWDSEGRPSYDRLSELAVSSMRSWGNRYPYAGYGGHFYQWLADPSMGPYNSCGNGSAMRISAVGWAATSLEECINMSRAVTQVTHNHPDGIKGAEATAVQIFLARNGMGLKDLEKYEKEHYYNYDYDLQFLMKNYSWHSLCNGTCQPAFQCLYESTGYEDSVRNCMAIGGDCDTTGAICGAISEAVYGVPEDLQEKVRAFLEEDQIRVVDELRARFIQ